jgi:hypothetical protein
MAEKQDPSYGDSPTRGAGKIGGTDNPAAHNRIKGHDMHQRQCTGGCIDNTPGQVGMSNVDAMVYPAMTESGPKGLDSMGGTEMRGRANSRDGSGY